MKDGTKAILKKIKTTLQVFSSGIFKRPPAIMQIHFAKKHLPKITLHTLENPDDLQIALNDPRRFLQNYPKGVIIDEVQNAPELFSYIQGIVDSNR